MKSIINIDSDGERAIINPARFLGEEFFEYRAACDRAGGTYDKSVRKQTASHDSIPAIITSLRTANFQPMLSQRVADMLRARKTALDTAIDNASRRLKAMSVELAKQGHALRPYQVDGTLWLATRMHTGALLADEQGLGKTLEALMAIEENAPVLVVAPANATYNWLAETRKWRPDLTPHVLKSSKSFAWPERGEMLIVSHDMLPPAVMVEGERNTKIPTMDPAFGAPQPDTTVVIDEIQKCINARTKRAQSAEAVTGAVEAMNGTYWGLTGTPTRNKYMDMWRVLSILHVAEEAFGTRKRFKQLHEAAVEEYGSVATGAEIQQEAVSEALRRVSLRRLKKDHLPELPPVIQQDVRFELDETALHTCEEAMNRILTACGVDLQHATAQEKREAFEKAIREALRTRRGVVFQEMSRIRKMLATAKIPAMLEMVETAEENGEPLIVFCAHRDPIDTLAARPGWLRITGSETPKERKQIMDAFQTGQHPGIALTYGAGAEAITLTAGKWLLEVDLPWTSTTEDQALSRFDRYGQTGDKLLAYRLIANHALDWRVVEILVEKSTMIKATLEKSAVKTVDVTATSRTLGDVLDTTTVHRANLNSTAAGMRELKDARTADSSDEVRAANWLRALPPGMEANEEEYALMLAGRLVVSLGLTDRMWRAAVRIATKYGMEA